MSMSRHCAIYKSRGPQYWLELADEEYAGRDQAFTYGPFNTEKDAEEYLDRFSNPGGIDYYGTTVKPKRSPNGMPIQRPTHKRGIFG